jgi:2-isopropylmalate synthase
MTGNLGTPTASVTAWFDGEEMVVADTGVGPVDAALRAIQKILGGEKNIKLREFRIEAITGGADALAEVYIGVENGNGRVVTARGANQDIVMASVEALVTAINLLYERERS